MKNNLISETTLNNLLAKQRHAVRMEKLMKWLTRATILSLVIIYLPIVLILYSEADSDDSKLTRIIKACSYAIGLIVGFAAGIGLFLLGTMIMAVLLPAIGKLALIGGIIFVLAPVAAGVPVAVLWASFHFIRERHKTIIKSFDKTISKKFDQIAALTTKISDHEAKDDNTDPKKMLAAYKHLYEEYSAGEQHFGKSRVAEIKLRYIAYRELVRADESITRIENLENQGNSLRAEIESLDERHNLLPIIGNLVRTITLFVKTRQYQNTANALIKEKDVCHLAMISLDKIEYSNSYFDKITAITKNRVVSTGQSTKELSITENSPLIISTNSYQFNLLSQLSTSFKTSCFRKENQEPSIATIEIELEETNPQTNTLNF